MEKSDLELYRTHIDDIDVQIAQLFERRMEVASNIAQYKRIHNMPIFDPVREEAVLHSRKSLVNEKLQPYFQKFMKDLMNVSKEYQHNQIDDNSALEK